MNKNKIKSNKNKKPLHKFPKKTMNKLNNNRMKLLN